MEENIYGDEISNVLPKYYTIKEYFLNEFKKNKYSPGQKIPSERELKLKFRVSGGPVKRAINELSKEGYLKSVQGKGVYFTGLNCEKQNISKTYKKEIAFITVDVMHEFISPVLKGILDIIQPKNFKLNLYSSEENYRKELQILGRLIEDPPQGIIFTPCFSNAVYKHLFKLKKIGVKIVLLERYLYNYQFDCVCGDDIYGAKKVVKYLIKSGHKKIAFVAPGSLVNNSFIKDRFEGYKQALRESKIKYDESIILINKENRINYKPGQIQSKNYKLLKDFLKNNLNFTAIFAVNDSAAMAAYHILKQKGVRVPEDISIAGYDDLKSSSRFEVPLTTVRQDAYHLGYYSAKILFKKLNGDVSEINKIEKKILKPELVIRKSVKK